MIEMSIVQKICIWVLPILFAITLHEVAHGWVALWFGDKTAKLAGRLTINPIKHVDLVGTIIVPITMLLISNFIFGWAKPVPVDARNLRNPRYNMVAVAIAGPASNFLMAFFWAGIAKLGLVLKPWFGVPMVYMGEAGILINVVIGVLNCLPIPPLDGARALYNLLPGRMAWQFYRIEPFGFFILLILMFTNVLYYIIVPPVQWITECIMTVFGLA